MTATHPPPAVSAGRARAVSEVDGTKIRWLRTTRVQKTQAELAVLVGISRAEISHLENGKRKPLVVTFASLCRSLDCEPWEILAGGQP
jgi:DNA-binding Xre family transcriptional regulator